MSDSIYPSVPVIDRFIELQPARIFTVDGFDHIDKDKSVTLFKPPVPSAVNIHTLSGLVSLIENGFEGFDPAKVLVQVEGYNEVSLAATASDKYGRRQEYVTATALEPERKFKFNHYMVQEEFNIALRSMFVQDDALNGLVELAGNIAKNTEVQQEDDGFSQRVTAKAGVVMKKEVTVKSRVTLRPFRTFLEVDQPEGDFIFRVQHNENLGNLCALFEADGGGWKLTAIDTIAVWLRQQLGTSDVEAVAKIPVIA